jgi:hypothetical protein
MNCRVWVTITQSKLASGTCGASARSATIMATVLFGSMSMTSVLDVGSELVRVARLPDLEDRSPDVAAVLFDEGPRCSTDRSADHGRIPNGG